MKFFRSVELVESNRVVGEIELECSIVQSSISIRFKDCFGSNGEMLGQDFFYVLADLRKWYEEKGVFLLCVGGLLDVFPGGLTSDSSFGELAYQIDASSGEKEVVNIFDSICLEKVNFLAGISEQKEMRRAMIKKLKHR